MQVPDALLEKLQQARHVVAFTGAGVSAESGVPTFRDQQTGLWAKYRAEDLATPAGFRRNPQLVFDWYEKRYRDMLLAQPNAGHRAIAELERHVPRVTVVTQNTDDLHERAGSSQIYHLHGSLMRLKCFGCDRQATWEEGLAQHRSPPVCPDCGDWWRPATVMFHEVLPEWDLSMSAGAVTDCDLLFVIGTSGLVYPAADLPFMAKDAGATLVQVNPQPASNGPAFDYTLAGQSGEILPALLRQAFGD